MTKPMVVELLDVTDEQLADLMELVNVEARHPGWRTSWSRETRARVALYCRQEHLSASDNPVRVPVRPIVLKPRRRSHP